MAGKKPDKQEVAEQARRKIAEIVRETGLIEKTEDAAGIFPAQDSPDLAVEISGKISCSVLAIEARTSGELRVAREAVCRLGTITGSLPHVWPVFAAPYISGQAAEICKENNTGYLDLAGNCRIALEGLFIHTGGNPNPYAEKRRLKSLSRPKAARVVRTLLNSPARQWKTRELAKEAGVSLGLVSNISRILADREIADRKKSGLVLTRPAALLELWAEESLPSESISYYRTSADFLRAENSISRMCREKGLKCAFTGLSAAIHMASGTEYYRQIQVRTEGEAELGSAPERFEKCSPEEANTAVIRSRDSGVFRGTRKVAPSSRLQYCRPSEKTVAEIEREISEPIQVVSPVQAWFDLVKTLRNGEKEADRILRQVIEPSW